MLRAVYPIFHSHLDLAHQYWEKLLQKGDWAIDATCGNGNDTLKIAEILLEKQGGVIGIDIQQKAIDKTDALLQSRLSLSQRAHVHLFCQCHTDFPLLAKKNPIRLIVYNLGYLPKGNKQMTTLVPGTLESFKKALDLIVFGGAVCITAYPGHDEGRKEEQMLLQEATKLSSIDWNVCYHSFPNRILAPSLLLFQKKLNS